MTEPESPPAPQAAPAPAAPRGADSPAPPSPAPDAVTAGPTALPPAATPPPPLPRPGRAWLGFVAGVALVAGFFAVQHFRHGWPFSLHHGLAPLGTHGGHAAGSPAAPASGARVDFELDEAGARAAGVATVLVEREELAAELRAVATVVPDESRVSHVHTRVAGWIDRLAVRTTGETVRNGQVLGHIFSRELLASQTEYLAAVRTGAAIGGAALARAARDRLVVLGMIESEIDALERRGTPSRNVPILSPRAGVVLERGVTVGAAVDPSTDLFVIADLSTVWVLAEVPEARMAEVAVGAPATLELVSSGVPALESSVSFVYPTLTEGTRTLRVRFVVDNDDGALRPGAFGTAVFRLVPRAALVVPRDAVVDRGTRQHVFVTAADGHFEAREVAVGARIGERVEILDGLAEGERVVSSGVFLLDSESRLRSSGGTGHVHGEADGAEGSEPSEHAEPPATGPEGSEPSEHAEPPATGHVDHEGHEGHAGHEGHGP